ncbi:KGG domain-containing protein [Pseudarthrobacter sp. ATCC 49987]|uniref:general stress protein n=1 Tax=Pseudarthrobacter sp. ATCC 49987 TaxID=2698204 RepID=UPI001369054E
MAGTVEGGKLAAQKNKELHGADFYARIGAKGGANGNTGGFAADPELARIAGAKGGRKSRRTKKPPVEVIEQDNKYKTFVDKLRGKKSI